jgi:hypothetical protein
VEAAEEEGLNVENSHGVAVLRHNKSRLIDWSPRGLGRLKGWQCSFYTDNSLDGELEHGKCIMNGVSGLRTSLQEIEKFTIYEHKIPQHRIVSICSVHGGVVIPHTERSA